MGILAVILLGVKNSNKNTSEVLMFSPCLNFWCALCIFGHFSMIPASFYSSAAVLSRNNSPSGLFVLILGVGRDNIINIIHCYCFGKH